VQINVGVPDIFRQIDNDGQFSEFFDTNPQFTKPYMGRTIFNNPNDGLGFDGRLVTQNDLVYARGGSGSARVWEVAIPWSDVTQLRGFPGKTMAISIDVSGDRLFESDHAARFTLVAALPGDYNNDNVVDAADYVVYRRTMGQPVTPFRSADGSGNGVVGFEDYEIWRAHFGQSAVALLTNAPATTSPAGRGTLIVEGPKPLNDKLHADAPKSQVPPKPMVLASQVLIDDDRASVDAAFIRRRHQLNSVPESPTVSRQRADLLAALYYLPRKSPNEPVDHAPSTTDNAKSRDEGFAIVDEVFANL
jgi:hypothetical protein